MVLESGNREQLSEGLSRALKEIRDLQKTTGLLIRRAPFQRVVRDITQAICAEKGIPESFRITADALHALQTSSEDFLVALFDYTKLAAGHAGDDSTSTRQDPYVAHCGCVHIMLSHIRSWRLSDAGRITIAPKDTKLVQSINPVMKELAQGRYKKYGFSGLGGRCN